MLISRAIVPRNQLIGLRSTWRCFLARAAQRYGAEDAPEEFPAPIIKDTHIGVLLLLHGQSIIRKRKLKDWHDAFTKFAFSFGTYRVQPHFQIRGHGIACLIVELLS